MAASRPYGENPDSYSVNESIDLQVYLQNGEWDLMSSFSIACPLLIYESLLLDRSRYSRDASGDGIRRRVLPWALLLHSHPQKNAGLRHQPDHPVAGDLDDDRVGVHSTAWRLWEGHPWLVSPSPYRFICLAWKPRSNFYKCSEGKKWCMRLWRGQQKL